MNRSIVAYNTYKRLMFLLAIGLALLLPAGNAQADVGPKPSMKFTFEYEIEPVSIVSGQLLECQDETCTSAEPLRQVGPQRFKCTDSECSSQAYGYAPYHKLVIEFADRTRESNVFTKNAFAASFRVTVSESALRVQETGGLGGGICPSLFTTVALETLIAAVYLSIFHLPRVILGFVPTASLLTLPAVWFLFPQLPLPAGSVVAISEVFAVLFEAGFIYLAARRLVAGKHIAILALVMNVASFAAGLVL